MPTDLTLYLPTAIPALSSRITEVNCMHIDTRELDTTNVYEYEIRAAALVTVCQQYRARQVSPTWV